eukprot:9252807-Alexandrium_andersonii.AAC.1
MTAARLPRSPPEKDDHGLRPERPELLEIGNISQRGAGLEAVAHLEPHRGYGGHERTPARPLRALVIAQGCSDVSVQVWGEPDVDFARLAGK